MTGLPTRPGALGYYATPGRFTDVCGNEVLSSDVRDIVRVVQGLLVYDVVAEPFYGVSLTPAQADTIHERDSARLLDAARAIDPRPIDEARPPATRVGARCHAFSRLTVALLRAAGVPARARCGFGAYFRPGWLEDHWVAEYWNTADERWHLVDAQLDATWREMIGFEGDPFAITTSEFVTAGHAWQAWRRGELDAGRCGLSEIGKHGAHWIAGNLRLDLASLNKVEMLPWDVSPDPLDRRRERPGRQHLRQGGAQLLHHPRGHRPHPAAPAPERRLLLRRRPGPAQAGLRVPVPVLGGHLH